MRIFVCNSPLWQLWSDEIFPCLTPIQRKSSKMSEITCIRSSLTIEELRRIIQVYIYQTVEHGYISKDIQMIGFIQVTFLIVSAISISILSCSELKSCIETTISLCLWWAGFTLLWNRFLSWNDIFVNWIGTLLKERCLRGIVQCRGRAHPQGFPI